MTWTISIIKHIKKEKKKKEMQALFDVHSPIAVSLSSLLVWFAMNENKPVDLKSELRGS